MHCWGDLQSLHGFRCYDNIAPNAKFQRVLVLALCLISNGCSFVHSIEAGTGRGFSGWGMVRGRSYNRATDEGGNTTMGSWEMLPPGKLKNS